jgi:hypothetical protein
MGWMDGILDVTISEEDAEVEEVENLILNYGSITLKQVVESEMRYISRGTQGPRHIHVVSLFDGVFIR